MTILALIALISAIAGEVTGTVSLRMGLILIIGGVLLIELGSAH